MSDVSTLLLNAVTAYGLPVACIILFLGALGLPLPSTIIVIMLGAFVREHILSPYSVVVALVVVVCGDLIIFWLGSVGRSWIPDHWQRSHRWVELERNFAKRAGMAIFLTRCFLTAFAFPASLFAGSSKYPLMRFLAIDLFGEAVWIAVFGGLGYAFSSQSDLIAQIASNVTGVLMGMLIVGVGAFVLFRFSRSHASVAPS